MIHTNINDGVLRQAVLSAVSSAGNSWEDELELYLDEVNEWLEEPAHIYEALEAIRATLLEKHHDYGEDNLKQWGELGILVRVSDKVARLKNLISKDGEVQDESRADTWRDLAGYAIQALIMMTLTKNTQAVKVFEKRKNRLIRGMCPDCGEGVLLRSTFWDTTLHCSRGCGFETGNLYEAHEDFPEFEEMINYLAGLKAVSVQN